VHYCTYVLNLFNCWLVLALLPFICFPFIVYGCYVLLKLLLIWNTTLSFEIVLLLLMPTHPEHIQRKFTAAYYNHFFRHNNCRQFTANILCNIACLTRKVTPLWLLVFCPFLWTFLESERLLFAQYLLNMLKLFLC